VTGDRQLDAEDAKLVTLANGAMARAGAAQGAAVRDEDGRTYSAAAVSLPSLALTALQAAVAVAAASGARALEAAVIVGAVAVDPLSLAVARDLSTALLYVTDGAGAVLEQIVP
jgi:hypothetical protein